MRSHSGWRAGVAIALALASLAMPLAAAAEDNLNLASAAPPPAGEPAPVPAPSPGAEENKDLELIPPAAQQGAATAVPPTAGSTGEAQRLYLENAVTLESLRGDLPVPVPPPPPFDWQERLLLDAREQWAIGDRLLVDFSDRLNVRAENDIDFPNHENAINDLREAYLSWQPISGSYVDLGRINLKSGVALGYNPTDYFKTRAVVEPLSADPTVLREDRLGTLMLRAQQVWQGGSLTAAFAPRLYAATALYSNLDLPSFDPTLDRTNAANRLLLRGSANVSANFNPEVLWYREGSVNQIGLNITRGLGQRTVAYLEWSGGTDRNLISQALHYGRETGTLPALAPSVLATDPRLSFQNQLALGASYTSANALTVNLEYHFNRAAFTAADWQRWFMLGAGSSATSLTAGELWYVRAYASDQQQPLTRQELFVRADVTDAFIRKLELGGFIDADLHDGSSLLQLSANYFFSDKWTLGALAIGYLGGRRTDFGSLPLSATVLLEAARYL